MHSFKKLRPFFPPLAPLQSLNLRAALYRGLTELKKNGTLGKEAVLRKTMLDECKGEKFEEVIRVFAIAVLRKEAGRKLGSASSKHSGYSATIAAPENLTAEERERLMPLVLAHARILRRQLSERGRIDKRFHDEKRRLDDAHSKLAERQKTVLGRERQSPAIKPEELEWISDYVRAAWIGNGQWAEMIIRGGPTNADDLLVGDCLHGGAQQLSGTKEHEMPKPGPTSLLAELNGRIAKQQSRLQKWQDFRASLEKSHTGKFQTETVGSTRIPILTFSAHQALQLDQVKNQSAASGERLGEAHLDHPEVIAAMRTELAKLRGNRSLRRPPPTKLEDQFQISEDVPEKRRSAVTIYDAGEVLLQEISSDADIPSNDAVHAYLGSPLGEDENEHHDHLEAVAESSSLAQSDGLKRMSPALDFQPAVRSSSTHHDDDLFPSNTPLHEGPNAHSAESSSSWTLIVPASKRQDECPPPRPTESSISSSPPPHLRVQRQNHFQHFTEPLPLKPTAVTDSPTDIPSSPPPPKNQASTLLERTRQSMGLLPTPSEVDPSNQNLHITTKKYGQRQRQQRKPPCPSTQIFPINQFSTPHQKPPPHHHPPPPHSTDSHPISKPHNTHTPNEETSLPESTPLSPPAAALQSGTSTPRDQLFSDQADYASVFKSRPRVAASPPVGPSPERSRSGVLEGEHGDGDEDEEEEEEEDLRGGSFGFSSSPVRGRR